MTAFDALMPRAFGVAQAGGTTGVRGSSGDWRQAVESAQAKSWLGNRDVNGSQQPAPQTRLGAPAGRSGEAAHGVSSALVPTVPASGSPNTVAREHSYATRAALPDNTRPPIPAPRSMAIPITAQARAVMAEPIVASRRDLPGVSSQVAFALAARPRKQSLHVEAGERGVSVWVRDTTLNDQQAQHLASAIVAYLGDDEHQMASLYLNGRAVQSHPETSTSLSSTKPSE